LGQLLQVLPGRIHPVASLAGWDGRTGVPRTRAKCRSGSRAQRLDGRHRPASRTGRR
jgi:hypothetical protein